jgi:hypothetical protein
MQQKIAEMEKKLQTMTLKRAFTIEDVKQDDNKVTCNV